MWTPDDLDIQIVRTMASPSAFQWDPQISHAAVASSLGIDESKVRSRLLFMRECGFLEGWQLIPNPDLLGGAAAEVELKVGDSRPKAEVIARLSLVDGVTLIDDFYGEGLAVHVVYDSEEALRKRVQLLAALSDCAEPVWWPLAFPTCRLELSTIDWKIIETLRRDARGRLSDVARALSLSTRTIKRRMVRLTHGNAIYLDPILRLDKVAGLRCRFWMRCDPQSKEALDAEAQERIRRVISVHAGPREHSVYVAHCQNASEVQEISRWLVRRKGVREVRSNIEIEHVHVQGWLSREITRRLSPLKVRRAARR